MLFIKRGRVICRSMQPWLWCCALVLALGGCSQKPTLDQNAADAASAQTTSESVTEDAVALALPQPEPLPDSTSSNGQSTELDSGWAAALTGDWSQQAQQLLAMPNQYQQRAISLTAEQQSRLQQVLTLPAEQQRQLLAEFCGTALQVSGACYQWAWWQWQQPQASDPTVAELLDRALAANPHNYYALNLRALLAREQGQFAEAAAVYQQALAAYPGFAEAHLNLAILQDLYLQQPAKAAQHYHWYQGLLTLAPQGQPANPNSELVAKWLADLERRLASRGQGVQHD